MFEFKEIKCPRCKSLVPLGYIICPYCGYDLRPILRMYARRELTFKDIIRRVKDSIPIYGGSLIPTDLFNEIMIAPDALGPTMIIVALSFFISLIYMRLLLGVGILASVNIGVLFVLLLPITLILNLILFAIYVSFINWIFRLIGATNAEFTTTFSLLGYSLWPLVGASLIALFLMIAYNPSLLLEGVAYALSHPLVSLVRYILFAGIIVSLIIANEGISKAYYLNKFVSLLIMLTPIAILFLAI